MFIFVRKYHKMSNYIGNELLIIGYICILYNIMVYNIYIYIWWICIIETYC